MSEWFKEHDWKSCVGLKPTGGSNPLLCANKTAPNRVLFFRWRGEEIEALRIIGGSREENDDENLSLPRSRFV